ncbi:HU family DNA-binding protein, partial [Bacteroides intestinalis]|uniref:HU family DNA-binding protein n=1 Tax=Bacteroides intestinalis TaxID=329854 RepID=UPI003219E772
MAIPYIVRRKADVSSGERKELWYAVGKKLQKKGGKTERDVAHQVAQRTGFHRGVVEAVLAATGEIIEEALSDGHSVTLRGIGSFQTAVTSKGFEQATHLPD